MFYQKYWSEPRKHDRKKTQSSHSKKTGTYPGHSAGLQGWVPLPLHIHIVYCALSAGSKPLEEVPKVIPAWQVGAWKARFARENLRRAPCRASSAPEWRRYLAEE